jgi:hypothetical protein
MASRRISRSLRQRVVADFAHRCAYCHTLTAITGACPVLDHIIPAAAGGQTVWENLCVACHACNEFKGAQMEGQDALTGEPVPLFHPRQHVWREHFRWSEDGSTVMGLTPTGRATVEALQMNHPVIVEARRRWVRVGWHPPQDDL